MPYYTGYKTNQKKKNPKHPNKQSKQGFKLPGNVYVCFSTMRRWDGRTLKKISVDEGWWKGKVRLFQAFLGRQLTSEKWYTKKTMKRATKWMLWFHVKPKNKTNQTKTTTTKKTRPGDLVTKLSKLKRQGQCQNYHFNLVSLNSQAE